MEEREPTPRQEKKKKSGEILLTLEGFPLVNCSGPSFYFINGNRTKEQGCHLEEP